MGDDMTATVEGIKRKGVTHDQSLTRETIERTYSTIYIVRTTSLAERELAVLAAPGIPRLGDTWIGGVNIDIGARCVRRRVSEIDDLLWEVTCEYRSTGDKDDDQDKPPEQRQPEWWWEMETEQEAFTKDAINGDPLTNSAGDAFQFALSVPKAVPILHIRRYELTFSPTVILNYVNHVNDAPFWGAQEKAAWLSGVSDRPVTVEGEDYRQVEYQIKFAVPLGETWEAKLLDQSVEVEGGRTVVKNLDGAGGLLVPPAAAKFRTFNRFPQADFSSLDLGPY